MKPKTVKEKCPKCEAAHIQAPYGLYKRGGDVVATAPDVACPCGLALRWQVPFFKITESGYVLSPRKDSDSPFDSTTFLRKC